jgi:hypothetical protein
MARTAGKKDKKLSKVIDKREPGGWSLKWAEPFTEKSEECESVWQTK